VDGTIWLPFAFLLLLLLLWMLHITLARRDAAHRELAGLKAQLAALGSALASADPGAAPATRQLLAGCAAPAVGRARPALAGSTAAPAPCALARPTLA
jgi:hypothetical protein